MEIVGASSSRITIGGLATGLDTSALLEGLMAVERIPLDRMNAQRAEIVSEQGLFRDLNNLLLDIRSAAEALDNRNSTFTGASTAEEFLAYQATSANENLIGATADGSATPGTYSVRVDQLAAVGRDVSAAFADTVTPFGGAGDTFSVDFGGAAPIDVAIPAGGISLDALRAAINDSPENGGKVRAEILFDGTSYRLVTSGTQTGAANDIAVATSLTAAGGQPFLDATLEEIALDANLEVLGVPITRASNQISDAIPGVSLDLRGIHSDQLPEDATQITVSRDDDATADGLQTFIDAVNALRDFSIAQSTVNEATGGAGPLSGEPLLRSLENTVFGSIVKSYDFAGSTVDSLALIGVRSGEGGKLSIDRDALGLALDANPLAVRQLLGGDGTTDGAMTAIARALKPITETGGLMASRDESFDDRIAVLDQSIERFEARLVQREETLIRRFSSLESTVAQLQTQAGFLSAITVQ